MIRFRLLCDVTQPASVRCMGCGGTLTDAGPAGDDGTERVWACAACRTEVVTVVASADAGPRGCRPVASARGCAPVPPPPPQRSRRRRSRRVGT